MIGAGIHGNGRHWYNVSTEDRVIAMKVSRSYLTSIQRFSTNSLLVLVALRNWILFRIYFLQDLNLYLLDANLYQPDAYSAPLFRHGSDGPCWTGVHVPHAVAMQAIVLLLDSIGLPPRSEHSRGGLLYRHGNHYRHDIRLQCFCRDV